MADPAAQGTARGGVLPERVLHLGALLGGFVLFAIMLLVSVSVFFRYALNQPILGNQELVEIGMSVVVMLAMPYAGLTNQHIRVDILDHRLGSAGRFVCDLFARVISILVLGLLVRKAWSKALDAHEYGDVTNMIEVPVWIAYGAITLGMGFFILVLVLQLFLQFRRGIAGYE